MILTIAIIFLLLSWVANQLSFNHLYSIRRGNGSPVKCRFYGRWAVVLTIIAVGLFITAGIEYLVGNG